MLTTVIGFFLAVLVVTVVVLYSVFLAQGSFLSLVAFNDFCVLCLVE